MATNKPTSDQFSRLSRACDLIIAELQSPSQRLLRSADLAGCLDELELLLDETSQMLDDDMYLEELAWEMAEKESIA